MMTERITLRPADERGLTDLGWLKSRHTFSFGAYHDPAHGGYRALRVINDDRVAPGKGFGAHAHDNMEIVSYVVTGALEHRDSMGNGSVLRPGDVQRMSAGTGVRHSEYNPSATVPVHFLQLWIEPDRRGLAPGYVQQHYPRDTRRGRLTLVLSREGRDGSLPLHADVDLYAGLLNRGDTVRLPVAPGRHQWVQMIGGSLDVNGVALLEGDGLALQGIEVADFRGVAEAEFLVFDLA